MIIVLDANIYVSAMVNLLGNPRRILDLWERGEIKVLLSPSMIEEVGQVLRYPRIVKRHRQAETAIQDFINVLAAGAIVVEPAATLDVVHEDESDNRYVECAVSGGANYIVTGDHHLLDVGEHMGIVVLTPAAFIALLERGEL